MKASSLIKTFLSTISFTIQLLQSGLQQMQYLFRLFSHSSSSVIIFLNYFIVLLLVLMLMWASEYTERRHLRHIILIISQCLLIIQITLTFFAQVPYINLLIRSTKSQLYCNLFGLLLHNLYSYSVYSSHNLLDYGPLRCYGFLYLMYSSLQGC